MKKMFRKNQVVVSALAVMIAVAGYLTYAGREGVVPMDATQMEQTQAAVEQTEEVLNQEQAEGQTIENQVAETQAEDVQATSNETEQEAEATLEDIASLDYDVSDTIREKRF